MRSINPRRRGSRRAARGTTLASAIFAAALLPAALLAEVPADSLWSELDESLVRAAAQRDIVPTKYRTIRLDIERLDEVLRSAPLDNSTQLGAAAEPLILSLPMPEGDRFQRFAVVESPIMAPELAAKFPQIKTYRGQGLDDPSAHVRFDRTPKGFHAMILSPAGRVFIDPYGRGDVESYLSYRSADYRRDHGFTCGVEGHGHSSEASPAASPAQASPAPQPETRGGTILRTYRLAVAATGEYTAFHGGTVADGQAAIVTSMNRVNGIYEQEVAIRMVLVANNDLVVYTDGATDPYTNNSGGAMLGENQINLNAVIGTANYDIGHVFSTGGGGIAGLGVPCTAGKARGVTGLPQPIGDPFWVDFVAHELGHQWDGNHTFNGNAGSCAGANRNPSTAYEPGSGTTIQAYAGICGAQNIQSNSDPFFHGISLDEIIAYSQVGSGSSCAGMIMVNNSPPSVEAGPSYTIPLDTPFELCGSGTDADGDPVTFSWEQFDLGPAGAPDAPVGNAAIFRSFSPTASPCRTFPRPADLAADQQVLGEILPSYARTLNFRLTARDNRSGGGRVADDSTTVDVIDTAGPFRVLQPAAGVSVGQGAPITVTWDVADTDQAPISCTAVDIALSTDGGLTFPTPLADGVANSGTATVTTPNMASVSSRLRVRCSDNIFFNISEDDFGIGVPSLLITGPGDGNTVNEGETVTFTASAVDPEDGDLATGISWTSSLDGALGGGGTLSTSNLSLGTHVITAQVSDGDSNSVSSAITLQVLPLCVDLDYEAGFETGDDGFVDGSSTCTTGRFIRGTPDEVIDAGIITQVAGASSGTFAWFTANNGGGVGTDDVDSGTCETLSPVVSVAPGTVLTALVDYFHGQRDGGDDPADGFVLDLIDGTTGALVANLVTLGDVATNAEWTTAFARDDTPPASVRLRARVTDGTGGGDLVEAGLDNVRLCTGLGPGIFTDGFELGSTAAWSSTSP